MYLQRTSLFHPVNRKDLEGTSLRGGMKLRAIGGTAKNRPPNEDPEFSWVIGTGIMDLLRGNAESVKIVGYASDSEPDGVLFDINGTECVVQSEAAMPESSHTQLSIKCGLFVNSQSVPKEAGKALLLYMLMKHRQYPDVVDALKDLHKARSTGSQPETERSVAVLADTVVLRVDEMINGTAPDGTDSIDVTSRSFDPPPHVFTGGDDLIRAFQDEVSLDDFVQGGVRSIGTTEMLYGAGDIEVENGYVGTLALKVADAIITCGESVCLTGPTETGKTLCVRGVARKHNAPLTYFICSDGTEDRDLVGCMIRRADGGYVLRDGVMISAMKIGQEQYRLQLAENEAAALESREPKKIPPSILFLDEFNRLQTRHQNMILGALTVDHLTDEFCVRILDTQEDVRVKRGFFSVVVARNFGAAYVGTNDVDIATLRRFDRLFDVEYLDEEQELDLLKRDTGIDGDLGRMLVKVAHDTRFQLAELQAPLGTGKLKQWASDLVRYRSRGVNLTVDLVLEAAKDRWFDVVVGRDETGRYADVPREIISQNVSESWQEVFGN